MGGRFGRPRIRREKRKKFYRGVYLQLRSNLFYQKSLEKTSARRPEGRRAEKPGGSQAKISSPKTPPFFARSPKFFLFYDS